MIGIRPSKRDDILAAATSLLAERRRVSAVKLDEVVARAGTTKATLYRYFPSKADLIREIAPDAEDEDGRREHILDAAMKVLARQGLAGATIERIATEAGISSTAIYWYFKNKDDLFIALVERLGQRLNIPGILALAEEPDPTRLIHTLTPRALAVQGESIELLGIMLSQTVGHPRLVAELHERVVEPLWGSLAAYFQRESEAARLRPGHPLLRVVALIGMMAFYNLSRRVLGPRLDLPPPDEAADQIADIFLRGVAHTPEGLRDVNGDSQSLNISITT